MVLDLLNVPLQGSYSVPAVSAFVFYCNVKDNRPMALFETKEGDSEISPSGRYFGKSLGIPLYQIAHRPGRCEAFRDNCFKIAASKFLILTG
jgi:hypothetical protein